MSERRYSEDEVREIFGRATDEQQHLAVRPSSPTEGLTLEELQDIGRDVGIAPELVASAARSLEVAAPGPRRTLLGLPIGVGHTVELDRALTDAEWHQLVVHVRETFDARGRLTDDGPFRQWTNGNLEVLLEPTATGQRLRMRTLKQSARGMILGGGAMLGFSAFIFAQMLATGTLAERFVGLVTLVAIGLGMLVPAAVQLPGWARTRQRQMEEIGARALLMSGSEPGRSPDSA
jgi:hypothetical protein